MKLAPWILGLVVGFVLGIAWSGWWETPMVDAGASDAAPASSPTDEVASTPDPLIERSKSDELRSPVDVDAASQNGELESSEDSGDPRGILAGGSRSEQALAIEALLAQGTSDATLALLDAFLATDDPVLLAMLEEALLLTDVDVAPELMDAYAATTDPRKLARLASLLTALAERHPYLEGEIVETFVAALTASAEAGGGDELMGVAAGALSKMGRASLDALAAFLADPSTPAAAANQAAWALSRLDVDPELVRGRIDGSIDSLIAALSEPGLTLEQRDALLRKTQSLTWLATTRPEAEHDALVGTFVDGLLAASDHQHASNIAWAVANLEGLSLDTRVETAQTLFDSLDETADPELRQTFVWAVGHLATFYESRPLDETFYALLELTEQTLVDYGGDADVSVQMNWLLDYLREYERERGGQ